LPKEAAELPKGLRLNDFISLGVIAKIFPRDLIDEILIETKKTSERQRNLPAHVMVYFVIALSLYMQESSREVLRCLREGLQRLFGPRNIGKTTGKSGISQARKRLGVEPVKTLYHRVVVPIATKRTKGARYRKWTLVSLDGSTLDIADTEANEKEFGRPGSKRGESAFPKLRFVSLVENGTHVLFGAVPGRYNESETSLAKKVIPILKKGMLCIADRYFYGYNMWRDALKTKADLLWRVKKNLILPCIKRLEDGSYESKIYNSPKDRRLDNNGITVRVIEYTLKGVHKPEPLYRLITTILDPQDAPANELAALYQERWEIETALDELKTHLRGRQIVLRSKMPYGVYQEFYGLMLAHFAVRSVMHDAALLANEDPDRLSFVHTIRVIKRKLPLFVSTPPSEEKSPLQSSST
jgi:hypothetical protein